MLPELNLPHPSHELPRYFVLSQQMNARDDGERIDMAHNRDCSLGCGGLFRRRPALRGYLFSATEPRIVTERSDLRPDEQVISRTFAQVVPFRRLGLCPA